ncbi:MAG: glycine hydroxymethyltransferase [Sporichthyaceae bacterium]
MSTGSELIIERYLNGLNGQRPDPAAVSFYASLDQVASVDPEIAGRIVAELRDQRSNVKLIASENYCSLAVQQAMGNLLTDKYAEGYAGHRFYAGCDNVDVIEARGAELARNLFGAEYAYIQPHSGIDANLVAYAAILATRTEADFLGELGLNSVAGLSEEQFSDLREKLHGAKLLGMDYYSGGHLTHGYRFNISARMFEAHAYAVDRETGLLDYDALRKQAHEVRPLILLAGYSAYPRAIDFAKMREIADEVGATFMVDMAHFAGLVAGKVFTGDNDPVAHAHVVTSTTHKTLRGPRGGIVLAKGEYADAIDKGCPAILGGPLAHVMAAKTIALNEASKPEFATYAQNIVTNSRALADALAKRDIVVATGGTDNHLVLADVQKSFGLTGRQAESALRAVGITLNRNSLPFDANGPWYTSGLRLGTPAITTLGMGVGEVEEIADVIATVLKATVAVVTDGKPSKAKYTTADAAADEGRARLTALLDAFPVYPELDLSLVAGA